jgi:hypothetical protein
VCGIIGQVFSGYLNFKKDIPALEKTDAFNLTAFCYDRSRGFGGRFGFCLIV